MNKISGFFKSNSRPFWAALFSGILIGTSYIPFPGWALLFCYAPLWLSSARLLNNPAADARPLRQIFAMGWLTQFILTLIGFNWIYYVSSEFGLLHWSLSATALLLFAALMHLYIPVSLVLAGWLIQKANVAHQGIQFLVMALCLALLERIWPSIFEWNLGYSLLWMNWPLFQWADFVGFWGLSTWILVTQAFLTYAVTLRKSKPAQALKILTSVVATLSLLTVVGVFKEKKWSRTDQILKIGVVQGNIGNADKVMSEQKSQFHTYILGIYLDLSEKLLQERKDTQVLLWPETALPFALDRGFLKGAAQTQLLDRVERWKVPLITGAYSVDFQQKDFSGNPLYSNAVFAVGPQRDLMHEAYSKTDLLVFGEYMPMGRYFPFLYQLLPFVGQYKVGPGPSPQSIPLNHGDVVLGPQICYESLNPGFSRGLSQKGAQIMFNVTNDSWFGWWAEPFQHQYMTLGRAVEVRRPLVRATNTGFSSTILANGKILENSPINQSWAHTYEVPYLENPPASFYTRFGHWDWALWLFILIGLLVIYRQRNSDVQH